MDRFARGGNLSWPEIKQALASSSSAEGRKVVRPVRFIREALLKIR